MGKCFLHGNGGAVIERMTGTIDTSTGTFSVNTGFKPDLVVITNLGPSTGESTVGAVLSAPFAEHTGGVLYCAGFDNVNDEEVYIEFTQTNSGFSGSVYYKSSVGGVLCNFGLTMKYTAVKYA
jgi:hypothetical protein